MMQKAGYGRGSGTAVVILHEIYGINRHIRTVCRRYSEKGFDVYCPDLIGRAPFPYSQQGEAYEYFQRKIGFGVSCRIRRELEDLHPRYAKILLVGYSAGATLAWISAQSGLCDGLVAYYGSRIRDYAEQKPPCPCLLLFAERETSFDVSALTRRLQAEGAGEIRVFPAGHGFCDPFTPAYDAVQAGLADRAAEEFIGRLLGGTAGVETPPHRPESGQNVRKSERKILND